ncbi:TRAP transporter small permease [Ruegeria atlantica]|uniref:TRAP transporter small permease n=1 Tax=Ruegeria atlantica TaxID=81569 RepID=UPI00147D84EC|nr:TRAP transporter small permease subunit [Ruegeria atlantica]
MKRLERGAVVFLYALMVLFFASNVIAREIAPKLAVHLSWTEEASRLAMIWGVFLVSGITLERGRHIAMTTLLLTFPPGLQRWIERLINLIGLVFFVYLAFLAGKLTLFVYRTGQTSPSLGISNMFLYLAPAIGFTLIALRYLAGLLGRKQWRTLPYEHN